MNMFEFYVSLKCIIVFANESRGLKLRAQAAQGCCVRPCDALQP